MCVECRSEFVRLSLTPHSGQGKDNEGVITKLAAAIGLSISHVSDILEAVEFRKRTSSVTQKVPTTVMAETRGHCACFGSYERKLLSCKYDFSFLRSLLVDSEEPNAIELRAIVGRQIVSKLPTRFISENNGRFVAVTYTGKVLAVCNTLEALNKEIAGKHLKENYYIERLGYSTIAQI